MQSALMMALIMALPAVQAMTLFEAELTCPIGGEKFKQTLAGSGTRFGTYLDTRPMGPHPAPWPMAKCPGNGYVLFTEHLTDEQRVRLEAIIASADYRRLAASETNYALAAYLMTQLAYPSQKVAYVLVQAAWEAADEAQARRYMQEALAHYVDALSSPYDRADAWIGDQLLAGELERRLGRFDAARSRFEALLADRRLPPATPTDIAKYQLDLISRGDTEPHLIPEPKHD